MNRECAVDFSIKRTQPETIKTPCVVVPVFRNRKLSQAAQRLDKSTNGQISRALKNSDFDAEPVIQTTLSLPPQQLGPLMINRFCITDDEGADGNHSTRIADAFVAHASLHCADDASNAVIYVAVSLDIELSCKAAVPPEEADDQEASSSESRF